MNFLDKIKAVSYIGEPKSHTAMFLTAKAGNLLGQLDKVEDCLIFAEYGLEVPESLQKKHRFEFSDNPQSAYYYFSKKIADEQIQKNKNRKYRILENGARIGENVELGNKVVIGANVIIEHDCKIGNQVVLGADTIIKRALLSDNVQIAENVIIGADAFNLVQLYGNLFNMPTLGKVQIASAAYIGAQTIISAGLAGMTRIGEHVQIDAACHIHHDCQISQNVTLCSTVKMGGFVEIAENSFIGIGTQIKNRIKIGKEAIVGMGSVVIKDVEDHKTIYGNPAK